MKVILTNLSDELYGDSRRRLNASAGRHDIPEILSYDFADLKGTPFYRTNRDILDQPVGSGYWLWKPYIILEAMKTLTDGDIVVYSDCGIEIIESLDPLITICRDPATCLIGFGNGTFTNAIWTKRDCFVLMDCDTEQFLAKRARIVTHRFVFSGSRTSVCVF